MADPIIPPRRGEFLTPSGVATNRFNEYLERITTQTNTTVTDSDVLTGINQGSAAQAQQKSQIKDLGLLTTINQNSAAIASLKKKIKDLELLMTLNVGAQLSGFAKKLTVISVSANYTSVGNEIIVCTNTTPITITLSSTANDKEEVIIVRQNTGLVTVSGPVNGDTTFDIVFRYDVPHLLFTRDAGEYNII